MSVYKSPERLTNDSYMTQSSPVRLFKQRLDGHIDTHWHEFYEMGFVVAGSGTHVLNGVPLRIGRGDAFLLTPADFHSLEPDPGDSLQLYDLIFGGHFIREPLQELLFAHGTHHTAGYGPEETAAAEREFELIWEESENWQAGSGMLVQGSVERLLIQLSRGSRESRAEASGRLAENQPIQPIQPAVRKALIYIQHHFRETMALEEAAGSCGLSPNYFSECFRKGTGVTFQAYVQELRLQFAKSLLKTTRLPVTEICFASGFNTLPHFERAFKKRFGTTPREHRNL
ncbi:helix-turn-helix domain-containing protein [Paenibacillus sacheonensis]|uniref:Helix-turn-helix domain-containing protein n=1 Tax=Paenibacillus sacheonensis TaxID=742054 RepID=A0A7X4YK69_9BACL|nr:AraC family transcriptional regulator [Paenibacillus sacheonensis]MBM7563854.1 AraC-like DNA-binding protein [Paenibacillus sacheonensis]NBC67797.1 helix-turn-helix domain-containing protein [Paenibacillus sacheonensis]